MRISLCSWSRKEFLKQDRMCILWRKRLIKLKKLILSPEIESRLVVARDWRRRLIKAGMRWHMEHLCPAHRVTLVFKKPKTPLTTPCGHPGSRFCNSWCTRAPPSTAVSSTPPFVPASLHRSLHGAPTWPGLALLKRSRLLNAQSLPCPHGMPNASKALSTLRTNPCLLGALPVTPSAPISVGLLLFVFPPLKYTVAEGNWTLRRNLTIEYIEVKL